MIKIVLTVFCIFLNSTFLLGQIKILNKKEYNEFLINVKECKNITSIRSYLKKDKKINLFEIADTNLKLNIIELCVFPKIGEPIINRFEIKSDKEILITLEVLLEQRPKLDSLIVRNAFISLVKYSSYLYVPHTYGFLRNKLNQFNLKVETVLQSDSLAYIKWQIWKKCNL